MKPILIRRWVLLMLVLIFLIVWSIRKTTPTDLPNGSMISPGDDWVTSESKQFHYTFRHPAVVDGPASIRDDRVEMYREVEGLLLLINTIQTSDNPAAWLSAQSVEAYSRKPLSCFSQTTTTAIPSTFRSHPAVLQFSNPVLLLDNIASAQRYHPGCGDLPRVRVILTPHDGYILRITYQQDPLSEAILSTFRFTDMQ